MSETHIKKLNLKALKQDAIDESPSIEEKKEDSQIETVKTHQKESTQLDEKKELSSQEQTDDNSQEPLVNKPLKIAFDSIKKAVPEKEDEQKEDEQTKVSPKNSKEDELEKKVESDKAVNKNIEDMKMWEKVSSEKEIVSKKTEITQTIDEKWTHIEDSNWSQEWVLSENTDARDSKISTQVNNAWLTNKTDKEISKNTAENFPKKVEEENAQAVLSDAQVAVLKKEVKEEKKKGGIFAFFRRKKKILLDASVKKEKEAEKQEEEKVSFTNYESHFAKESSNFLNKFRNFKYTPKTRVWFVLTLISLTVFTIWWLMVTMPDKHSPKIYKASLIEMFRAQEEKIVVIPQEIPIEGGSPNEESEEEKEELRKQEELIQEEEKRKEKLRQHLLDKYSI